MQIESWSGLKIVLDFIFVVHYAMVYGCKHGVNEAAVLHRWFWQVNTAVANIYGATNRFKRSTAIRDGPILEKGNRTTSRAVTIEIKHNWDEAWALFIWLQVLFREILGPKHANCLLCNRLRTLSRWRYLIEICNSNLRFYLSNTSHEPNTRYFESFFSLRSLHCSISNYIKANEYCPKKNKLMNDDDREAAI